MSDDNYYERRITNLDDVKYALDDVTRAIEQLDSNVQLQTDFQKDHSIFLDDSLAHVMLGVSHKIEQITSVVHFYGFLILGVLVYIAYVVSKGHW